MSVYIVLCIDSFDNFETQNFENINYMSWEIDVQFCIMMVLIQFDGLGVNKKCLPCWQVVKYVIGSKCASYIQKVMGMWTNKNNEYHNLESIRKIMYIRLVG